MAAQIESRTYLMRAKTERALAKLEHAASKLEEASFKPQHSVEEIRENHARLRFKSVKTEIETRKGRLGSIIFHEHFETFGGCMVLLNFAIMTMETHAAAVQDDVTLRAALIANKALLAYYTLEFFARLRVLGMKFFRTMWNNLDFVIVVSGLVSEVLELSDQGSDMDHIAKLKSLRMLRLLRLLRLFVAFRELYVLVAGIGRCMKTLFWASGLMFVVLNVWAILSVELLDDKVQQLHSTGSFFSTCSWCPTAFSNVWYANLTWFQIISTADWTPIGRPLAEEFYWPFLFFVFCTFVIIWGLLNLIVAALVDASIAAREDDVAAAASLTLRAYQDAWASFADLCKAMDEDGSGDISVEEFKDFWRSNNELQQHMTIMGVRENDVDELLRLMAEESGGTLGRSAFIKQFTSMRTHVEKTTLFFVLKFVKSIQANVLKQKDELASIKRLCLQAQSDPAVLSKEPLHHASDQWSMTGQFCNAPKSTSTGNYVSAVVPSEPSALRNSAAQSPTTEKLDGDLQVLPHGWYFFGTSLPAEAGMWCKAMDLRVQVMPNGKFSSHIASAGAENHGTVFTTDGQEWETLPSRGPSSHAKVILQCGHPISIPGPEHEALEKATCHTRGQRDSGELVCVTPMNLQSARVLPPLPGEAKVQSPHCMSLRAIVSADSPKPKPLVSAKESFVVSKT